MKLGAHNLRSLVASAFAEPTPEGSDLVAWSGGLDSTLILAQLASAATASRPVDAFVIDRHPQMDALQLAGQRIAQRQFLALARARGWHVRVTTLRFDARGPRQVVAELPQATVWLHAILPYVGANDRLHLGYIRGDDFWHHKAPFEGAFAAGCALKSVTGATIRYNLEWSRKWEVVMGLQGLKIQPRCVWTCESPFLYRKQPASCGRCVKCLDLQTAIDTLARDHPFVLSAATVTKTLARKGTGAPLRDTRRPAVFKW